MKINKNYLPAILFAFLGVGYLLGVLITHGAEEKQVSKQKLERLVDFIAGEYVDEVNLDSIVDLTVNSILEKLDPHSTYIPSSESQSVAESMRGDFVGIGVNFYMHNDTMAVVQTIEGGPSEKAGILAGDRILMADNDTLFGKKHNNDFLFSKLKGQKGSKVALLVYRKTTGKKYRYTLERGLVNIKSVDVVSVLPNQVGYIKVNRFAESTYTEFKKGLNELASKKVKAVVVDLRDNPGGYLNEAIKMTDEFLSEGKLIVYTKDRKNKVVKTYATESGDFEKTKVYVLINESSASASEIFAGAIQDNDRGTVIGRRSFGKGLVQKEMPMGDGSSVRLTVSRYYTPTGRSIQKSYKNGTEEYYTDFYKRFYNGELKNKDSIKVNDTLKFKTPAGRIVYGGGGIMPDIFVPIPQGQENENLYFTSQMGITAHFVFENLDKTRASFQKLTPEQFVSANLNSDALYLDFVKYTINNGIQVDYGDVKKAFMKELMAEFIKQLYGEKAYYQFVLTDDPMVRKVLEFKN